MRTPGLTPWAMILRPTGFERLFVGKPILAAAGFQPALPLVTKKIPSPETLPPASQLNSPPHLRASALKVFLSLYA